MSLHPPVLFIGDRPNPKKNLDMNVPFVGTKSYKTLLEWIYRMDLEIGRMQMRNAYAVDGKPRLTDNELQNALEYFFINNKIITLGEAAAKRMEDYNMRQLRPTLFFRLPHPSGLNRELNDKKKLSELLAKCRAFVYKQDQR